MERAPHPTFANWRSRMLARAWADLGGDPTRLDLLRLSPMPSGLLPSRLAAMEAMVAAIACSAMAASAAQAARRGSGAAPETVYLDPVHVAAAARSERFARWADAAPPHLFAPLSRFWQVRDGWLRLHANYPWHRNRALTVLECDERPEAVAEAAAAWSGARLEEALAEAGALGFMVRSRNDWQRHPHGHHVARLPLISSRPQGSPRMPHPSHGVLDGIRVLDLTRVIAGPVATRTLAAWGADVLRIDSPRLPEIPEQAIDTLPGKRSAELDFALPGASEELDRLLGQADVLVQSYRPGALDRFGLSPEDLAERHPHLTVVTLSAWGSTGPWGTRRGFDSLVQCPTGIAAAEGSLDAPGTLPAQVLDHATGYLAAAAAMLSVASIARGDRPTHSELSLAQTAEWLQSEPANAAEDPVDFDAGPYEVELSGPTAGPVRVIEIGRAHV